MRGEREPWRTVRGLALAADSLALTEFEVHGMVRDAFRVVHKSHLERLETKWDLAFEKLAKARDSEPLQIHVQETGGENMSKPVKEFSAGSVRATIWENEQEKDNQKFTTHSVRVERRYKDANDEWKGTNAFRKNELPSVELVTRKAFEFLAMHERDPQEEDGKSEKKK